MSLMTVVDKKIELEEHLKEIYGEASEELEKLWENTQIELKDKLDNYGTVMSDLESLITLLKGKKKEQSEKITHAINHLENEIKKMKARLYEAGEQLDEKHLRGYNYSFHPFLSKTKDSIDFTQVEDKYKVYTISKLSDVGYKELLNCLVEANRGDLRQLIEESVQISAIPPKDHPSIVYKLEKSVRVT